MVRQATAADGDVRALAHRNPAVAAAGAARLLKWCQEAAEPTVLAAGGMAGLTRALRRPEPEVRRKAAEALEALMEGAHMMAAASPFAAANTGAAVVRVLRNPATDVETAEPAVTALIYALIMSTGGDYSLQVAREVVDAGGAEALVQMAARPQAKLRNSALQAMCNLFGCCEAGASAVLASPAAAAAAEPSPSAAASPRCCRSSNLCPQPPHNPLKLAAGGGLHERAATEVVAAGGVELLLAEIARPPGGASRRLSLPTAVAAARALLMMLECGGPATASPFKRSLHERAVAAGALRVAVAGAGQMAADAPSAACLKIITTLACSGLPGAYEAAADAGGIEAILAALHRPDQHPAPFSGGRVAPIAAEALGRLAAALHGAGAGGQLQALLDAGLLPQLVALASVTGSGGRKASLGSALRALTALAQCGDAGADAVTACGALPLAMDAASESDAASEAMASSFFMRMGLGDRPAKARRAPVCCSLLPPLPPNVAAFPARFCRRH
jgi:hypothetical protein